MVCNLDFAAASVYHESIGMSPNIMEYGYKARHKFDWTEYKGEIKNATE